MAYFEIQYGPDWKGIDSSKSPFDIDNNSLAIGSTNYLIKNGLLINGFVLAPTSYANLPDGFYPILIASVPSLGVTYFASNATRVVAIGSSGANAGHVWISAPGSTAWTDLGAFPYPNNLTTMLNSLILQGSIIIPGFNGIAQITPPATNASLTAVCGGVYIGELGGHILCAYTTEGGAIFPKRIRWSGVYNFGQWNPAVDATAGFQDLSDVSDYITGLFTFGTSGYILRSTGITQINVTSQGTAPFQFDHLWKSDQGIGCFYPFSAAQYGPLGIFVGRDDVYLINSGGYEAIGGASRAAIFQDLQTCNNSSATTLPSEYQVNGAIIPYFSGDNLDQSVSFVTPYDIFRGPALSYVLNIPVFGNGLSWTWTYDLTSKQWARCQLQAPCSTPASIFISPALPYQGQPYQGANANSYGGNFGQGMITVGTDGGSILQLTQGQLGRLSPIASFYQFKIIRPKLGTKVTIHKTIIEGFFDTTNSAIPKANFSLLYYTSDGTTTTIAPSGGTNITNTTVGNIKGFFTLVFDKVISSSFIQPTLKIANSTAVQVGITKMICYGSYGDGDQL